MIEHVYNHKGSHAIRINGKCGPFACYDHIAEYEGYLAVTDYYHANGRVYKVIEVEAPIKTLLTQEQYEHYKEVDGILTSQEEIVPEEIFQAVQVEE